MERVVSPKEPNAPLRQEWRSFDTRSAGRCTRLLSSSVAPYPTAACVVNTAIRSSAKRPQTLLASLVHFLEMPMKYLLRSSGDDTWRTHSILLPLGDPALHARVFPQGFPTTVAIGSRTVSPKRLLSDSSSEEAAEHATSDEGSTEDDATVSRSASSLEGHPFNVARLIPSNDAIESSYYRLECLFRGVGPFHLVRPTDSGVDAGEEIASFPSVDAILRDHGRRINSLLFDATSLPKHKDTAEQAQPVELLPSENMTTQSGIAAGHDIDHVPNPLPELTDLEIVAARTVSPKSLLLFLQRTPVLRRLSVRLSASQSSAPPRMLEDLPAVALPYLERLSLKGVSPCAIDGILSKLTMNPRTRIEVYLQPTFPSQSLASLRHMFSSVHHAHLSYTALDQDEKGREFRYLFTLSDSDGRVQVHWDWEMLPGDPASLLHISLDPGAGGLANITQLTVALRNVKLSSADWATVLAPFPSVSRVDLHATNPGESAAPSAWGGRTATFLVRAAPLLRRLANVPLMLAFGLTQHLDPSGIFSAEAPSVFGTSLVRKLYSFAWRHMVFKGTQ
ncbi:hypothetical protein C8Q77DRAFT_230073 [Trametes polyzona]|nr:hypothetical protein C8Q77DRAFT_230073 [Trametes polyzona]